MRLLIAALGIAAASYLAILVAVFSFQRSLIYPAPAITAALPAGFLGVELRTNDGLALKAAYRPATGDMATVVFFHGNGDSWNGAAVATGQYAAKGYGVLLAEYRGYGGNPGRPNEQGLYEDGRAALAFLKSRGIGERKIVLIGNSLGSGVATQLATEFHPAALVLISPFASLPDAAAAHYRWLPVRLLVKDRFDNLSKVGRINAPMLVLHGGQDAVIPFATAERLHSAATKGTLIPFPHSGHELAYTHAAQVAACDWLKAIGD
jgi:fermentation-respiration switch protein FrsA (DUF1100 family)